MGFFSTLGICHTEWLVVRFGQHRLANRAMPCARKNKSATRHEARQFRRKKQAEDGTSPRSCF